MVSEENELKKNVKHRNTSRRTIHCCTSFFVNEQAFDFGVGRFMCPGFLVSRIVFLIFLTCPVFTKLFIWACFNHTYSCCLPISIMILAPEYQMVAPLDIQRIEKTPETTWMRSKF